MANIRRRRGTPARRNSIIAAPRSLRAGIGGKVLLVGFRTRFSRERLDGCRLAARHRLDDREELVPKLVAEDVDDSDPRDGHERHDDDVLREPLSLAVLSECLSHLATSLGEFGWTGEEQGAYRDPAGMGPGIVRRIGRLQVGGNRGSSCGAKTVRISNAKSGYRSNSAVRIPYFFNFSNRVDLAIPSSRAVFVLFPIWRASSPRMFVRSACSQRESPDGISVSAPGFAAWRRKEKSVPVSSPLSAITTARWIALRSSRTFPGQSWEIRVSSAAGESPGTGPEEEFPIPERKCRAIGATSSLRSRRGGIGTAVSYTHLRAHETRHDLV